MSRYILAFDPSGNFKEGKGITGWVLFDTESDKVCKFGYISASMSPNQFDYWDKHITLIDSLSGFNPDVVCEDYLLYANRAENQINSRLETPQLIGVIKYECYKRGVRVTTQTAQLVKTRWNNDILVRKGYLNKLGNKFRIGDTVITDHVQDALRHAVHYATFRKGI